MVTDNDFGNEDEENLEAPKRETAPRARNRTVMLSPDVTGEVRARFGTDRPQQPVGALPDYTSPGPSLGRPHQPQQSSPTPRPVGLGAAPIAPNPVNRQPPPAAVAPARATSGDSIIWVKPAPIVGFLISYDKDPNGTAFELRSGRLIVTSESAGSGNCLLLEDSTVSPMHAILRISALGEIQVLDQLSEHGTKIVRFGADIEEELSGEKSSLEHGDLIMFGGRKFHVCLVVRGSEEG